MRVLIGNEVKTFSDDKAQKALSLCEDLCKGCDKSLDKCLLDTTDCPVRDTIEALRNLIRVGKGIRRYKEIGDL